MTVVTPNCGGNILHTYVTLKVRCLLFPRALDGSPAQRVAWEFQLQWLHGNGKSTSGLLGRQPPGSALLMQGESEIFRGSEVSRAWNLQEPRDVGTKPEQGSRRTQTWEWQWVCGIEMGGSRLQRQILPCLESQQMWQMRSISDTSQIVKTE